MKVTSSAATPFNIQLSDDQTWNVTPLLHEVKHALEKLINDDESTTIDLRSIPLAPGEETRILNTLGLGEVTAQLDSLGKSEVTETKYAGVWLITHYNDSDAIIGRFIEITKIPEILCSQAEDLSDAYQQLTEFLEEDQNTIDEPVEIQNDD